MKFNQIISDVRNKIESFHKPEPKENPLSRIYGYQRDKDGAIQIVKSEAEVIRKVCTTLNQNSHKLVSDCLDDLAVKFKETNIRNRSGKNWTRTSLIGLFRPVYAGCVVSDKGKWFSSKIYPAIITEKECKAALKRIFDEKVE